MPYASTSAAASEVLSDPAAKRNRWQVSDERRATGIPACILTKRRHGRDTVKGGTKTHPVLSKLPSPSRRSPADRYPRSNSEKKNDALASIRGSV